MKKLLVTLDFPPEKGGIQRYLYDKVAHTYGHGDAVFVGAKRRIEAQFAALPCRVFPRANLLSRLNKKWSIVNLVAAISSARRRGIADIVECGNVYAALAPWILSFFRPLRYRVYAYGGELLCLRTRFGFRGALFRSLLQRAETIFCIGNYAARMLRDAGIKTPLVIDPPRIVVPDERPPCRKSVEGVRRLQLLSVGRFVPHKGHAVLLEALTQLPAGLDWRLVLAGSGPQESRLRTLIAAWSLSGRVTIKTGLDDAALADEYRNADLFLLPSTATGRGTEGFGIVLLEAAAHGVPIVASRIGGVPEVLDNGACGVLVEPGSPAALSAAIAALSTDADKRKRLAEKAFLRVREKYAW